MKHLIKRRSGRLIASVASFAALYFTLSILPGIPVIGFPGITIELEASFASLFGVVLGPYAGALAAFVGTLIAFFYGGASPFGLPFILCPAINALVTGLIFKHRFRVAFTLFAVIIASFWLTPLVHPINESWYVGLAATFDKVIALSLILPVARILSARGVGFGKVDEKPLGVSFTLLLLASFIGNQADSALGSTIFAIPLIYKGIFGLNLAVARWLFTISPFAYPIIRLLQALIAASVGLPLIRALRAGGWLRDMVNQAPSCVSKNYSKPFIKIFEDANYDFYSMGLGAFAPAVIIINSIGGGSVFMTGKIGSLILKEALMI